MSRRNERVADLDFEDQTAAGNPSEEGQVRRVSNDLVAFIDGQVKSLTSGVGGSGLTEAQHRVLDDLVHNVAETSFDEVTRVSGQVTVYTTWASAAKTQKIRESTVTRVSGQVSQVVTVQYDAGGAAVQTLTEVITRSGGEVSTITRTLS